MPTHLSRNEVRRDTRPGRTAPTHDTPHTRLLALQAQATDSGHAAHDDAVQARHDATHVGAVWAHKHYCPHCADAVNDAHDALRADTTHTAAQAAATRAQRATDATRNATRNVDTTHDVPQRIGRKRRTTRNVVTPTTTGDTTRNGVTRARRATQRYAHDTHTRIVGDTHTTDANGVQRVQRNTTGLTVRGEGGVDIQRTMLLLAYYRHALACRQPNRKDS